MSVLGCCQTDIFLSLRSNLSEVFGKSLYLFELKRRGKEEKGKEDLNYDSEISNF